MPKQSEEVTARSLTNKWLAVVITGIVIGGGVAVAMFLSAGGG